VRWKCGGTRFSPGALLPINLIASPFAPWFQWKNSLRRELSSEITDAQPRQRRQSLLPLFPPQTNPHIRVLSASRCDQHRHCILCTLHNRSRCNHRAISSRNRLFCDYYLLWLSRKSVEKKASAEFAWIHPLFHQLVFVCIPDSTNVCAFTERLLEISNYFYPAPLRKWIKFRRCAPLPNLEYVCRHKCHNIVLCAR